MTALDRRALLATTAASIAAPTVLGAKECPTAGMDWITMSLQARNLAYNNVEHVGPDNARKKTETWAAASKTLREQCPQHLDLAYGNGERNKWDLYPANDPQGAMLRSHPRRLLATRQQGDLCLPLRGPIGARLVGGAMRLYVGAGGEPDPDHQRAEKRVRLARRQGRRARHPGADRRHRLVRRRASDLVHSRT